MSETNPYKYYFDNYPFDLSVEHSLNAARSAVNSAIKFKKWQVETIQTLSGPIEVILNYNTCVYLD